MQTEAAAAKALVSMESPAVCVPPLSTGAVPRVACPRCQSMDTKFCYLNNYNPNQPRWLCKSCQRYWTAGGTLRNVQPGAGRRKNKQSGSAEVPPVATSLAPSPSARPLPPPKEGSADGSGTEPEDAVLRPRSTRRRTQRARHGDSTSAAAPDGATPTPSPPQSSAPPLPLPWFAWSPAAALAAAHAPAGFPMCWAFDPSAAMWPYAMAAQQQAAAAQASLAAAQHVRLGSCDAPQLSRPKALYASGFHAPSGEAAGSLYGGLSHPALVPTPGPGAASLWANPSAFARSLALQQQACEQASAGAAKRQREGGDATQG